MSFRISRRTLVKWTPVIPAAFAASSDLRAAVLKPDTVRAFNQYADAVEKDFAARFQGTRPFLLIDRDPRSRTQLTQGETLVEKLNEIPDFNVPGGLIHDWVGSIFIPRDSNHVLSVLRDYDNHKKIYPEVIDSRVLEVREDRIRGFLRLKKTKVITVVLDTEHVAQYLKNPEGNWHIRSHSTRISEVENPGEPNERNLPPGKGGGYLWRLYGYWQLKSSDSGTLAECRAVSLTRSIPTGLGWVVGPFVNSLPRESLSQTLRFTREAVLRKS